MKTYTVVKGDNLTKIARGHGVSLSALIEANPQIVDPNLIYPNQQINIPTRSTQRATAQPTPAQNAEPPSRFIKGLHGKSHVNYDAFNQGADGTSSRPLEEPVPQFFARPGDGIISPTGITPGTDNNTLIIMGRDRTGVGEVEGINRRNREYNSGFSNYMGAGAIDIVAGRCAPFPVNPADSVIGPLYTTKRNIPELLVEQLTGIDPSNGGARFTMQHPGYAMDASRIYISQMAAIDETFKIQKKLTRSEMNNEKKIHPAAAIMIKSDKVRLHARQDIKIVTGGQNERVNSQGNDITQIYGIHLMAGNIEGTQQPIPLGNNLVNALTELSKRVDEVSSVLFTFVESQMKFNSVLGKHSHNSPFGGIITTPSITAFPKSVATIIDQFTKVGQQAKFIKDNLDAFRGNYLKPASSDKANKFINSLYNTTN